MIHSNYILSIIKYKFKYNNLKIQVNRYSEYKKIKDILEKLIEKFESINDELIDNQNDFNKIWENYNK